MTVAAWPMALASVFAALPARAVTYIDTTGNTVAPSGGTFTGSSGSPWTPGALYIGTSTPGSLAIQAGAVVNDSGDGGNVSIIGVAVPGSVTVTGAGATWNAANGVWVGSAATTGTLTVATGGTFAGGTIIVGRLTGSGTVTVGSGGLISTTSVLLSDEIGSSGTLSLAGGTLLTGSIIKGQGSAPINFSNGGVLQAAQDSTAFLSGFSAGDVTLGAGGGVIDSNGYTITVATPLGGTGSLTKAGAGTLTLSGANTYSGGTNINAGTLALGSAGALGTTGTISFGGGTLQYSSSNTTDYSSRFSTAAGQQYHVDTNGQDVTFAALLDPAADSLTKDGNGTLTLSNGLSPGFIGNIFINGGTLKVNALYGYAGNITDNGALVINNAADDIYLGGIAGTGSVTKTGAGTLTLLGSSVYTGDTNLDAGTLALGGHLALAGTRSINFNGGTLQYSSAGSQDYSSQFGRSAGQQYRIDTNGQNVVFATGLASSGGSLTKLGAGALTLTGANTYDGDTTISAGTLRLGDGVSNGSVTGDIVDNAALVFNNVGAQTYNGAISGTGTVTKQGAGTLRLSGANTYNGGTSLAAGTLSLGAPGALGTLGTISFGGGTLQYSAANATDYSSRFSSAAGQQYRIDTNGEDVTFASGLDSPGGSLTKLGEGTLTLFGTNTYDGGTNINGGTLALAAATALDPLAQISFGGGALRYSANNTQDYSAHFSTAANQQYRIDTNGQSVTFASGLASAGGSLTKLGAGMLTLTGANTYDGGTTISAGTLRLGDGTSNGSVTGDIVDNAVLVFDNGSAQTYGGAISGTGSLTKQGAGTLTLTGANSYEGGTLVLGGELVATAASLPGDATVDSGAYITFAQNADGSYSGVISGAGGVRKTGNGTLVFTAVQGYGGGTSIGDGAVQATTDTLSGDIAVATDAALIINQASDGSYAGQISGGGSLVKAGAGTVTLAGANHYTGPTAVLDGTLAQGAANAFVQNGAYIVNGGTLDLHGYDLLASSLTGTGGTVALGGGTLTVDQATSGSYAGAIKGQGQVIKDGAGTLTMSGGSDYSGPTTVRAGVLQAGATNAFSANSAVTIESAATLDVGNTNQAIGSLAGAGKVLIGTGTLATGGDGTSTTYSGTFSGSGGLLKQGGGLLILNGNSSVFTGLTTVAGGELEVGDIDTPSAVLGGNVAVSDAAVLRGHGTILGNVSSTGTVAPGGSIGTLTVGGNYTQASTGTLQIEVSPTQASQLKVGGTASLAGTLALVYDPGTYTARSYTIVSAAGGVNGTFGTVSSTGTAALGTLAQTVAVGANTVDLVLAEPATPVTSTPGTVVVAPTQTSIYTALGTTALLGAQSTSKALLDRAGARLDARSGADSGLGSDSGTMAPGSALWATLTGNYTRVDGNSGAHGFQSQRYGFLTGHDRPMGSGVLGVAFGYDHADIQERGTDSSGKIDTLRLGVYGSRAAGPVVLGATAGVGVNFLSQKRSFDTLGTAEGNHTGQEATLGLQAGLPLQLTARTLLTPKLGLRYAYLHADSFSESGAGGQNLDVGTDNIHSLQPYAGLALDQAFGDDAKPMNAQVRVGYAYETLDAKRAVGVTAQDGTPFTATGAKLPRGSLTAGASFTLHPRKNLDVSLDYDALINTGGASAQQGSLRVSYRF
ncbi:autotransporter-associated beta strand repeat-containing protein [Achromobacter aloeverae]|nr:autotransporter-associated beta strand repeat-containing protein [Achromobacter aloeverae]